MSEEAQRYAVYIRPAAHMQLAQSYQRLLNLPDISIANHWYSALQFILAELSTSPWCYSPAPESWLFGVDVNVALHQPDEQTVISRILFCITETDDASPFVTILHARHGITEPVKQAEARKIEQDDA